SSSRLRQYFLPLAADSRWRTSCKVSFGFLGEALICTNSSGRFSMSLFSVSAQLRYASAMAGFAALNLIRSADVLLLDQVMAYAHLVNKFLRMLHLLTGDLIVRTIQRAVACPLLTVNKIVRVRASPSDVEDRIARRTNVLRRITMTVETPLHLQTRMRICERHLVDRSLERSVNKYCMNADLEHELYGVRTLVALQQSLGIVV